MSGRLVLAAVPHHAVRWRGLITLIAVIALATGMGQTSLGHAILAKVGLFEEASYTSLAFLRPQTLPKQLSSRQATVVVPFVIHNASGIATDYHWSVALVQGQRTRHVAAGNVRVASGRGASITRSATISCTRGQVRIVVSLERPAESIDALTACSSRR